MTGRADPTMRDAAMVAWIVRRFEGEFSDRPNDRGGPTNYGVSSRLLSARYGRPVTRDEVRNLTFVNAVGILVDEFSAKPKIYQIDHDLVRLHALDFAIHSGADTAIRGLQVIRGVGRDGIWGSVTARAVNNPDISGDWLARELLAYRLRLLGRLISRRPTQAEFAGGWLDRCATLCTLTLPIADPAWPVQPVAV
jgi:lysozyme family protein